MARTIDIGIDLGTANTVLWIRDKEIIIDEPSAVAFEEKTKRIVAVGRNAKQMIGKTPEGYSVICPIERGMISNGTITEKMVKHYVAMALERRRIWGRPNICVSVPCGATAVAVRAIDDIVKKTGARNVYIIETPLAAALGTGIDVDSGKGHMIVDIGAGVTSIGIIYKGGLVYSKTLDVAGDEFDKAIIKYIRQKYNVLLGMQAAEELKIETGAVYPRKKDSIGEAKGKELIKGLPIKLPVRSEEIIEALSECAETILDEIKLALLTADPELVSDIATNGITLTGGGSKIFGMDKLISEKTNVKVNKIKKAEHAVALGIGRSKKYAKDIAKEIEQSSRRVYD